MEKDTLLVKGGEVEEEEEEEEEEEGGITCGEGST